MAVGAIRDTGMRQGWVGLDCDSVRLGWLLELGSHCRFLGRKETYPSMRENCQTEFGA